MTRESVSGEKITEFINNRVVELGGTTKLSGVLRNIKTPDAQGCNWTIGGICGTYSPEFNQAVDEARAKYNLLDEDL